MEITTAARRLARDINDTVPQTTVYYDGQGHGVGSRPSAMLHANPADVPEHVVQLRGRRGQVRLTQRQAQDLLDQGRYLRALGQPVNGSVAIMLAEDWDRAQALGPETWWATVAAPLQAAVEKDLDAWHQEMEEREREEARSWPRTACPVPRRRW